MNRDATQRQLKAVSAECAQLAAALLAFEAVLEQENAAIARSDLKELEAITDEKIRFGESVKTPIRRLKEGMDALLKTIGLPQMQGDDERQLTHFAKEVQGFLSTQERDAQLDQAVAQFAAAVEHVRSVREKIFAKVEINAYLVKKLLQFHRETYAFWQAVAQESEATYGQTGRTKATQRRSILSVRT